MFTKTSLFFLKYITCIIKLLTDHLDFQSLWSKYNLFLSLYFSLLTHPTFPYLQLHVLVDTCSWHDILTLHFIEVKNLFTIDLDLAHSVRFFTHGLDSSPCLCLFPPVSALPCLFPHPTGLPDVLCPQIEFWTFFCKYNKDKLQL